MLDMAKMADAVHDVVRSYVSKSQAPILERLVAVEAREPVTAPKGDKGDPGEPADRSEIIALTQEVAELGAQLLEAKRLIDELLARAPVPGPKGDPGESVKGDPGDPGKSIEGPDGKPGRGIADAVLGEDGTLTLFFSDATTKNIGRIRGREGIDGLSVKGDPGPTGTGWDDLIVEYDGERTFSFVTVKGEQRKEHGRFVVPLLIDRGVYRDATTYERGDVVSYGGSAWTCKQETTTKPGDGASDWRLTVKKGRDGKDGEDGKKGDRGADGRVVREYGA